MSDAANEEASAILSFPAAVAQEAFWFLDQLEPGSSALNVAVRFHLAGPLDGQLMEKAFNEMIKRHEILRTHLELEAGDLKQVVLPSVQITLDVIDLSHLPESERRVETERQGSLDAHRRFRLNETPLIRANLLRLGRQEHMLQVTLHHAISDGWSVGLMTNELTTIYDALIKREPCPLPALPIQFADFTLWQREYLQGPVIASQLDYWKRRLAGCTEPDLPTDRPRPLVKRWNGEIVSILLPDELTARLQRISQDNGATLFMTFLATFKVLLLRYTGQTDIAIGSPVVGRTRVEIEKLIGVFINTLILRTDLSGNPTFSQALKLVRETVIEAMANQDLPFETLVKELHPHRDLSKNPLFQINFIHQRDFVKPVTFGGVTLTAIPSRSPGAIFDMQFFMVERDGIWRASCDFNNDLFDKGTAVRMLGHFHQLLTGIASDPDTPIQQLEILTPDERRQMLLGWNSTDRTYPGDETVPRLFEDQASRNPDKTAVVCGENSLTYSELDQAANRVSAWLKLAGAKPGVLVGICIERSLDMIIGVLGILKSGAAYVPLDPAFPEDRIAYMIEDAKMPVIVTQAKFASILPAHKAKVLTLDVLPIAIPMDSESPRERADDLAYVIYTSGSTGRPKGVQISHRSVVNLLCSMQREPGLAANEVFLAVTTLSFDISVLELFLPLITGAKLVIAPRDIAADGTLLLKLMADSGTNVMQATPATWRMLIDCGWQGDPRLKILCGGESVGPDLAERVLDRCGELWNMYGPTETTIWSTTERLVRGAEITIGRPIANTQVFIVDGNFQPVPIGVIGELLIGGDGVAVGYLNKPELTRERFVPHPFDANRGAVLYRTGDLARYRADGRIDFLGRGDNQVKIRGFRIELGEIETTMSRLEGVARAVVIAREDTPGNKRLVAYLVPKIGKSARNIDAVQSDPLRASSAYEGHERAEDPLLARNPAMLRAALRTKLPDYMIPSSFVVLEALPLTPNGKVDRKALAKPDDESDQNRSYEAPHGATEEKLAGIMGSLLGLARVGRNESFFDLGGHSILAVTLFSEIERVSGKRLPLATLFRAPTIAHLAAALETTNDRAEQWPSLVPINPKGSKAPFFCVHGAGGNVLLYRDLARHLGADYPMYGLQCQGLDGKATPLTTVEAMAEKYLREIRKLQPEGPYYLGGYCLGGTIAYEMAQRLNAEGEKVAFLALLDTYNFCRRNQPRLFSFLRQKIAFHWGNLMRLPLRNWSGYLSSKLRVARDGEFFSLWQALTQLYRSDARPNHVTLASLQEVNDRAAAAYEPLPYGGRVTLFKPEINYDFYPDPQMGWGNLVLGGLELIELRGNPHAMLVEPYVRSLASRLKEEMEKSSGTKTILAFHQEETLESLEAAS